MSNAKLEHKGYNRGLILGLTMAESMILLVFCLLLIAAAIILAEQEKLRVATQEAERLHSRLEEVKSERNVLGRRLVAIASPSERANLDEEWRELVSARDAYQQMQEQSIAVEDLSDLADAREIIRDNGYDLASIEHLIERLAELEEAEESGEPHRWPPIISLSDADDYSFEIGSSELTPSFEDSLRGDITDIIAENLDLYGVDIVEVIGHTDEQPIARKETNFDQSVLAVLKGHEPVSTIIPADNAGLGLARAIAVVDVLRTEQALSDVTILPLSAGQLILPSDNLTTGQSGDVRERRRIEIRIRRRDGAQRTLDSPSTAPSRVLAIPPRLPPLHRRTNVHPSRR